MDIPRVGVLQTVQVGTPRRYGGEGTTDETRRPWETSFFRAPSPDSRWLFTTHLEGNAQADTKNHGRPGQAVLLYAAAHYAIWREELGMPEIGPGGFGENFTISGLSEETARIGDTYGIGAARIQVSGPRYPCWKIERRWEHPGLTARVAATGRTGWYCRVLTEGLIEPGAPVVLIERPYPQWTVALVNDFGHDRNADLATARTLAACPLLNDWWQELVIHRALKQREEQPA
ncbi:MAG TPA: MOSC domain-containing protein [Chloroflexota bacterium]|jgi:MOSC domain-containing protein YiiM